MMVQGKSGETHNVDNSRSVNPSGNPGAEVWDKILFFFAIIGSSLIEKIVMQTLSLASFESCHF